METIILLLVVVAFFWPVVLMCMDVLADVLRTLLGS